MAIFVLLIQLGHMNYLLLTAALAESGAPSGLQHTLLSVHNIIVVVITLRTQIKLVPPHAAAQLGCQGKGEVVSVFQHSLRSLQVLN